MFNLENTSSSNKREQQSFDLEVEMQDLQSANNLKRKVKESISMLQGILRTGLEKDLFEKFQILSDGFLAVEKVLNRINRKMD